MLLLEGGLALLLLAIRLVAAALSSSFSAFAYLPLPDGHGWRVLLWLVVAVLNAALLPAVLRRDDDELWLTGTNGGVGVRVGDIEGLLIGQAVTHPEVVTAEARVSVRKGLVHATLSLALRPLVAGDGVAGEVAAAVQERLVRVTGTTGVDVRVRHRVLTVRQLAKELP